jgi:hypothetical protein
MPSAALFPEPTKAAASPGRVQSVAGGFLSRSVASLFPPFGFQRPIATIQCKYQLLPRILLNTITGAEERPVADIYSVNNAKLLASLDLETLASIALNFAP